MIDKLAIHEKPSPRTVISVIGFVLFVLFFLAYSWSGAAPATVFGVVQSSGVEFVGKAQGGTQQVALVLLSDGTVVPASVVSGGLVGAGDNVRLLKQRRLVGGSFYVIVANESRDKP